MSLSQNSDRTKLRNQLSAYEPMNQSEKAFRERMLFLLDHHDNCFERSLLHVHFTASAWIVNPEMTHCLLTHHAKLDRWLQLGGHADGDANLQNVCLKEVREESGLTDIRLFNGEIFDIDIHLIPERKGIPAHDHYDIRFLVIATLQEALQFNHEAKDMKWIELQEVYNLTEANDSIQRMVNKTLELNIINKT